MIKLTTLKDSMQQLQESLDLEAFRKESKGNEYFEQAKRVFGNNRSVESIFADSHALWESKPFNFKGLNLTGPEAFMRLLVKIRAINRDLTLPNGEIITVTQGDGLRHEFQFRVLWLIINHRKVFMTNLDLLTSVGSIRDWFELWRKLLEYRKDDGKSMYLSQSFLVQHTLKMLSNETQREYVLKYMPTMSAKSSCTTLKKQCNNIIASAIAKALFVRDGKVWDEVLDSEHKREGMSLFNEDRTFNINARAILQKNYRNLKKTSKGNEALRIASSLSEKDDPEKEEKDKAILEKLDTSSLPSRLRYVWRNGFAKNHGLTINKPSSLYKLCSKLEDLHDPTQAEVEEFNSKLSINPRGIPKMLLFLDLKGASESSVNSVNLDFMTVASLYIAIVNQAMKDTKFYNNLIIFRNNVDLTNIEGETVLEQFIDTMTLSTEGAEDASVHKIVLTLCALSKIEGIPNKVLLITPNKIEFNLEDWEKMEETLASDFSKEFIEKLEIIVWNPTMEKHNNRIGNVYQIYGMHRDLINYLCGKVHTHNKISPIKQPVMRQVRMPSVKKAAARKSKFNKN